MKNPSSNRCDACKSRPKFDGRRLSPIRISALRLIPGELYLFYGIARRGVTRVPLWGIFDRCDDECIYLESSSRNLLDFRLWHRLPSRYRRYRLATRAELRDYVANLLCFECHAAVERDSSAARAAETAEE